jgi:hypothetical protein
MKRRRQSACRRFISLVVAAAFTCSLFASLAVLDFGRAGESEDAIMTLDICHAGDASPSINADSQMFAEFSHHFPFIMVVPAEFFASSSSSFVQFSSQDIPPPEV